MRATSHSMTCVAEFLLLRTRRDSLQTEYFGIVKAVFIGHIAIRELFGVEND